MSYVLIHSHTLQGDMSGLVRFISHHPEECCRFHTCALLIPLALPLLSNLGMDVAGEVDWRIVNCLN
jgi:hypothetical protein